MSEETLVKMPPEPLWLPVETIRGLEYAMVPMGMTKVHFEFLSHALQFYADNCPGFIAEQPEPVLVELPIPEPVEQEARGV